MTPLEIAALLLEELGPLLLKAAERAIAGGDCPLAACADLLDGEEAAAILAETKKFS